MVSVEISSCVTCCLLMDSLTLNFLLKTLCLKCKSRVATVREKYLDNEIFFQVREKSGILLMAREIRKDLQSQGKVWEFENKWLWQVVYRKFIYSYEEGKECSFS